jgi:hypothetical protein
MIFDRPRGLLVFLLLFALSFFAGCSDENVAPSCTGSDGDTLSVRITGHAIGGTGPAAGVGIRVEGIGPSNRVAVETYTDSTGTYDVAVRPGSYTIAALVPPPGNIFPRPAPTPLYYHAGGVVAGRDQADPIQAACGTRNVDLVFGSLQVRFSCDQSLTAPHCEVFREGEPPFQVMADFSNSSGVQRVTFPIVPPGVYRVRLSTWDDYAVWFKRGLSYNDADTIRIRPGSLGVLESTFSPHRFSASVTGSWQQMEGELPRVEFYAEDPRHGRPVFQAYTDLQGNCSGVVLAPGTVRMLISIGSVARWLGGATWDQADPIEIPLAGDIRIPPYVENGIHCSLAGPPPRDFAVVDLESATGDFHTEDLLFSVASFPNLTPGTYYLAVQMTPDSLRPQWFDRAPSREAATPIVVPGGGSLVPIVITLERGAILSGRILQADGTPLDGPVWLLARSANFSEDRSGLVSSDGTFRVEGLPTGNARLGAYLDARRVVDWYPGTLDESEAHEFDIQGQEEISGIEFRLLP